MVALIPISERRSELARLGAHSLVHYLSTRQILLASSSSATAVASSLLVSPYCLISRLSETLVPLSLCFSGSYLNVFHFDRVQPLAPARRSFETSQLDLRSASAMIQFQFSSP